MSGMRAPVFKVAVMLIISIIAGMILVIQIRADNSGNMYVSASTIDDYQAQIDSETASIEIIRTQIEETKKQLAEYEVNAVLSDNDVIAQKLAGELASYENMYGAEPVHGAGVRITIDDGTRELYEGEDINNILVHDIDILLVVNELKRCKAEAIAVNGHRITPYTSVICSGYTVRMDGMVYARPFEVTAIGDAKRIAGALLAPEGYGTSLMEWGVIFNIESLEDIEIPAATNQMNFRYAVPQNNISADDTAKEQ